MVDPIADLLNRIRNAAMARHASTRVPFSKMKARIIEILRDEGYIDGFSIDEGACETFEQERKQIEEEEDAFDKLLGTGQLDVKIGSEENPFS